MACDEQGLTRLYILFAELFALLLSSYFRYPAVFRPRTKGTPEVGNTWTLESLESSPEYVSAALDE